MRFVLLVSKNGALLGYFKYVSSSKAMIFMSLLLQNICTLIVSRNGSVYIFFYFKIS